MMMMMVGNLVGAHWQWYVWKTAKLDEVMLASWLKL